MLKSLCDCFWGLAWGFSPTNWPANTKGFSPGLFLQSAQSPGAPSFALFAKGGNEHTPPTRLCISIHEPLTFPSCSAAKESAVIRPQPTSSRPEQRGFIALRSGETTVFRLSIPPANHVNPHPLWITPHPTQKQRRTHSQTLAVEFHSPRYNRSRGWNITIQARTGSLRVTESLRFERAWLQPRHNASQLNGALAPEGISASA